MGSELQRFYDNLLIRLEILCVLAGHICKATFIPTGPRDASDPFPGERSFEAPAYCNLRVFN